VIVQHERFSKGAGILRSKQAKGALRVWRVEEAPQLELRVGTGVEHPYPKHWHEEFFISAITGGAGHFQFRGRTHVATPASLVVIVPGEIHTHYSGEGGRSFRSLHLSWSFLKEAAGEYLWYGASLPEFSSGLLVDRKAFQEFVRFHRALERNETRLEHETRLLELCETLLRHVVNLRLPEQSRSLELDAVRRARQFLQEHFNREVSLKELSAHVNLSPYYFHRSFCKQTGLPPHAYQIQLRLLHAKMLLQQKRWSLAHVAHDAGFADQSHFTRLFKRFTGSTPFRYASKSKNVQDAYTESL
jgi:AraC-like DNA-binding protein